jgi:hypothetical protein
VEIPQSVGGQADPGVVPITGSSAASDLGFFDSSKNDKLPQTDKSGSYNSPGSRQVIVGKPVTNGDSASVDSPSNLDQLQKLLAAKLLATKVKSGGVKSSGSSDRTPASIDDSDDTKAVTRVAEEGSRSAGFFSRVFRNVADVSPDWALNPVGNVVRRLSGQLDALTEENNTFRLAIWFLSSLSAGIVGTLALIRYRRKKRATIATKRRDKESSRTPKSKVG